MKARAALLAWISDLYAGKRVRISGEPYLDHLLFVAEQSGRTLRLGYEIGLCHDLFEDMPIDAAQLIQVLIELGYAGKDAAHIAIVIQELTTVYTTEHFPNISKKGRHQMEDERLRNTSAEAQTVKYADLIYNARWTLVYEPGKAKKYLQRKKHLLEQLTAGDPILWRTAMDVVTKGLTEPNAY